MLISDKIFLVALHNGMPVQCTEHCAKRRQAVQLYVYTKNAKIYK